MTMRVPIPLNPGEVFRRERVRKAGERIVQDLRDEADVAIDTTVHDMQEYLPHRRRQLAAMGAKSVEEGIALEEAIGKLRALSGGVPEALTQGRTRVHVEYDTNPITGETEVVPFVDPQRSDKALRTVTGAVDTLPRGHEFASEYLGEQILKLMGKRTAINNQGISPDGREATWRADLLDQDTKDQIDVQMRWTDGTQRGLERRFHLPQQVYTALAPTQSKEMTEDIIRQRMIDKDTDVVSAVESLIEDKVLQPLDSEFPQSRKGKMMKGNPEFTPNRADQFDKILMPGMSQVRAQRMGDGDYDGRPYQIELPDTVDLINLEQVNKVMNKRGSELAPNVFANENLGLRRKGPLRHQVQIQLPRDMRGVAENVVRAHPLTQQLLQNQPFI